MKRINVTPKRTKDKLKDSETKNIENVATLKKEISELNKINNKLHDRIIKLEVKNLSYLNRIKALNKEITHASQSPAAIIYLPDNKRDNQSQTQKQTK
jgi:hypothetical protein